MGTRICGDRCVDSTTDRSNCGACGHACTGLEICAGGMCTLACPTGQVNCRGFCIDTRIDPTNCGACGVSCGPGYACGGGFCRPLDGVDVPGCAPPSMQCGETCADVRNDNAHCGMCGRACADDRRCEGGTCVVPCAPGEDRCAGVCVRLSSSAAHCGMCGHACPSGMFCSGGTCGTGRRVFITSTIYTPDFGGLAGADAACQARATAAGLGGTFRAWISDTTGSAATRLVHGEGPYVLLDGTQIARDWADLTDGTLAHTINMTEMRGPAPAPSPVILMEQTVWTGTQANGMAATGDQCANWTVTTGSHVATEGRSDMSDMTWTNSRSWSGGPCGWMRPLYCFEN
jgi:hypothetical protein